jgi:hypothetical protein
MCHVIVVRRVPAQGREIGGIAASNRREGEDY